MGVEEFKGKDTPNPLFFDDMVDIINTYMYEGDDKVLNKYKYFIVLGAVVDMTDHLVYDGTSGLNYEEEFLCKCIDDPEDFLEIMVGLVYANMHDDEGNLILDFYCEVLGAMTQVNSLMSYLDGGWSQ